MKDPRSPSCPSRCLGVLRGAAPGPTLVVVAGVHGNEPAGVEGVRRALRGMEAAGGLAAGEVVALVGNRTALERGVRFVDTDLNRIWGGDEVRAADPSSREAVEVREARELAAALEAVVRRSRGRIRVLDLHTTSSDGGTFTVASHSPGSRRFAGRFRLPVVLGLGERLGGTLLDEVERRGWIGAVLEGGRHDDPASVRRAEAAVWLAASAAGVLPRRGRPVRRVGRAGRRLARAGEGLPEVVEVRHRHAVTESDALHLDPGLRNFRPIRAGERLGYCQGYPIHAPEDGLLLMPLYQAVGTDGFFLVRPVASGWERVRSAFVRWGRTARVALRFDRGALPWR